MLAYTYIEKGKFALVDKPKPVLIDDTVLIIGAGPTGICTLLCVMLHQPKKIIICEQSEERRKFIQTHYPQVQVVLPDECKEIVGKTSENGGADRVIEVAVEP